MEYQASYTRPSEHNNTCHVRVNGCLVNSFACSIGVRQGDSLSPTLFKNFLNGLAEEIEVSNVGIKIGDQLLSILLYDDDILILKSDLQMLLDVTYNWCMK